MRKSHPCATWCEGQLRGIVENLKLTGRISPDLQVQFIALRGLKWIPKDTYTLTCQHNRQWMLRRQ